MGLIREACLCLGYKIRIWSYWGFIEIMMALPLFISVFFQEYVYLDLYFIFSCSEKKKNGSVEKWGMLVDLKLILENNIIYIWD